MTAGHPGSRICPACGKLVIETGVISGFDVKGMKTGLYHLKCWTRLRMHPGVSGKRSVYRRPRME